MAPFKHGSSAAAANATRKVTPYSVNDEEWNHIEIEHKNSKDTVIADSDIDSAEADEPRSCCSMMIIIFIGAVIIAGMGAALIVAYTGGNPTEFFIMEDPPGKTEASQWRSDANNPHHLTLHVVNSLDDRYTADFDRYIQEWDSGSPDVLTLTTEKQAPDSECQSSYGIMNVCNGDYGATMWRGINIIFIQNDFIQHSVAKLNDYYLNQESEAQKAYTMCHEIGHGFGLPHTDENYFNIDRGDCMDYTTRPRSNLSPGQFNFDLLNELYGPPPAVDDSTTTTTTTASGEGNSNNNINDFIFGGSSSSNNGGNGNVFNNNSNNNENEEEEEGDRRRRHLDEEEVEAPWEIIEKYQHAVHQIETADPVDFPGWDMKLLKKGMLSEYYDIDLGSGYRVKVNKLRVE